MNKKKAVYRVLFGILYIAILVGIWSYTPHLVRNVKFCVDIEVSQRADFQVFYTSDSEVTEKSFKKEDVSTVRLETSSEKQGLVFDIPSDTSYIRMDFGTGQSTFTLSNIQVVYNDTEIQMPLKDFVDVTGYQQIKSYFMDKDNTIKGSTDGEDPYIIWNISNYGIKNLVLKSCKIDIVIIHVVLTVLLTILMGLLYKCRRKLLEMPKELLANRKLIFNLAKNDFRTKYAASYLGAFWAFVQPIVTIMIYLFVFQLGFKAAPTSTGYPFVLYLVSGIIPWFFFAEAWMNATNCLTEYSYLVKKMVFKISVLPIVKVISSLFVHLFFIVLAWVVFAVSGKIPGISLIQVIYYMFCAICFTLALSYLTAAITPFFPDATQIINILTQIGMWMTPIMYDEAIMPPIVVKILKFNPMYYVVRGYRDSFIYENWFWQEPKLTLYFWGVVIILFIVGFRTFKKLRVHFADVL